MPLHSTPPLGGSRRYIDIPFGMEKLEWLGYLTVKKLRICTTVYTQYRHVTDGQTDEQTNRQTDGRTCCHGIVRAMHTRRAVITIKC